MAEEQQFGDIYVHTYTFPEKRWATQMVLRSSMRTVNIKYRNQRDNEIRLLRTGVKVGYTGKPNYIITFYQTAGTTSIGVTGTLIGDDFIINPSQISTIIQLRMENYINTTPTIDPPGGGTGGATEIAALEQAYNFILKWLYWALPMK